MHPTIVSHLAAERREALLAEAAAHQLTRGAHHRPAARRIVGGWLVAVGTRVAGAPEPAPCPA